MAQAITENALVQMQRDLERALRKPIERRNWAMLINTDKCIGCFSCAVACVAENVLPPGVTYRAILDIEIGRYPAVERILKPMNCQQCENPPCVPAANAVAPGSMEKRPDGVVAINYERAQGKEVFEAVRKACPYKRAVFFDDGRFHSDGTPARQPYDTRPSPDYGKRWTRTDGKPPVNTMRKCHFCVHRLEAGLLPACVTTCIGGAMYFGDLNDAGSLISQMLKEQRAKVMWVNESAGTKPRVYYLTETPVLCKSQHP